MQIYSRKEKQYNTKPLHYKTNTMIGLSNEEPFLNICNLSKRPCIVINFKEVSTRKTAVADTLLVGIC